MLLIGKNEKLAEIYRTKFRDIPLEILLPCSADFYCFRKEPIRTSPSSSVNTAVIIYKFIYIIISSVCYSVTDFSQLWSWFFWISHSPPVVATGEHSDRDFVKSWTSVMAYNSFSHLIITVTHCSRYSCIQNDYNLSVEGDG